MLLVEGRKREPCIEILTTMKLVFNLLVDQSIFLQQDLLKIQKIKKCIKSDFEMENKVKFFTLLHAYK